VPPPFERVLVANRGEIAVRVCRALEELGCEPVLVHASVDRDAAAALATPRTRLHDIGGDSAADSYLHSEKLVEAALETGCQAVHPGYGFLSENPEFARAVQSAGLVFIGPDPAAMEQLGAKHSARQIASEAGVPTVPGYDQDTGDDADLAARALEIGYPLLLKATAGGGGKGMRLLDSSDGFAEAAAAARREAAAAFGDDRLLIEKCISPARHVEIQILGDQHGEVLSLHERECSIQRRHQKVFEEAPSPAVDAALRQRMGDAAVALAKHVGYRNAGTVEFLLDGEGQFYFLEVNTRLQVEHPVTELVTGLDLVQLQVHIAAGATLAELIGDRDLTPRGHAIEARLYAEDPANGFLPAAGLLERVVEPQGPGVRVDSGVYPGAEIGVHFDPMLAKLIVHAPDRRTACRRMAQALEQTVYLGIPTNVDFLRRVVGDDDFVEGRLRTDLLDARADLCTGSDEQPPDHVYVAAALTQALERAEPRAAGRGAGPTSDPWQESGPFRLWEDPK